MTRKHYHHWERTIGRVYMASSPATPARITLLADGPESVEIGIEIGLSGTDPIAAIYLSLSNTRIGRALDDLVFRIRKARGR